MHKEPSQKGSRQKTKCPRVLQYHKGKIVWGPTRHPDTRHTGKQAHGYMNTRMHGHSSKRGIWQVAKKLKNKGMYGPEHPTDSDTISKQGSGA